MFLAPALALFAVFLVVPICYTLWLSLRASRVDSTGFGVRTEKFVGFDNYVSAVSDSAYLHSVLRLLGYGFLVVPIMLGFALLFALLLDSPVIRFGRFSRIAIFLPYAVPGVIATLLWGFIYLPGVSPIREAADTLGLPVPSFLGPHSVLYSVVNIAVWGGIGFNMIIIYTSLRGLPAELQEAARIDGCNELQIAWRIKVPLVLPAVIMTAIFSLISTLQVFNEPQTLVPLTSAISSTWVPLMTIYRDAFVNNDVYTAAAASVVLAAATLVLSLAVLGTLQRRAFGEDR
ncbi:multiple sugar transport system permease protein [Motilibacter peucedani]|uniref:Multiple sugar transport system permease protein n=1 Tax=Motilibacter peucedani TaxID=598650 RepID=A0A420XTW8_9ACTN|nr:multiple sugar transport system permease protein [Motilibacter peucedani]